MPDADSLARWLLLPRWEGARAWPTRRGHLLCAACRTQTSARAGTVLYESKIPLHGWFPAMWLACTQQSGLSAAGLQRTLRLGTYRTAIVRLDRERFGGTVGVDDTYRGDPRRVFEGISCSSDVRYASQLNWTAIALDGKYVSLRLGSRVLGSSGQSLGKSWAGGDLGALIESTNDVARSAKARGQILEVPAAHALGVRAGDE